MQASALPIRQLSEVLPAPALELVGDITARLRDPARLGEHMEQLVPTGPAEAAELDLLRGLQRVRTPLATEWAEAVDKYGAGVHRGATVDDVSFVADQPTVWQRFAADADRRGAASLPHMHGVSASELLERVSRVSDGSWMAVKGAVDRPRPYVVASDLHPDGIAPDNASWVSGHSAQAFTSRAVMNYVEPANGEVHHVAASQVPISRMVAGRHFPTDVLGGAYMGDGVANDAIAAVVGGADDAALRVIADRWSDRMVTAYRQLRPDAHPASS